VVYASQVGNRLSLGDVHGAQDSSRKAKTWCWVTFGIGVALWVLTILVIILVIFTAVRTGVDSGNSF
jgi:predicted ferric reductase